MAAAVWRRRRRAATRRAGRRAAGPGDRVRHGEHAAVGLVGVDDPGRRGRARDESTVGAAEDGRWATARGSGRSPLWSQAGPVPRFEPFSGLRYDPAVVRLDQVIAPPYDVIEPAERTAARHRHPANAILVELPEPDLSGRPRPLPGGRPACSTRGGRRRPARRGDARLYPYRMTTPDGAARPGVIGALGLPEADGEGDILPHEQTMPKPRSDRLDLLRRHPGQPLADLGAVAHRRAVAALEPTGAPAAEPSTTTASATSCGSSTTPARRRRRRGGRRGAGGDRRRPPPLRDRPRLPARAAGRRGAGAGGHDFVMALIVELSDDQLTVGPIHRTLSRAAGGTDLRGGFRSGSTWCGPAPARRANRRRARRGRDPGAAHPRGPLAPHAPPEAYEAAGSDLDSSLVALVLAELPDHESSTGTAGTRPGAVRAGEARRRCCCGRRRWPRSPSGPRPAAHAAQDDLLQPQAPHRAWSSGPRPDRRRSEAQSTVQVEPERSRAARSPTPRCSWARTIWRAISSPYSGRSTARNTPIGRRLVRAARRAGTGRRPSPGRRGPRRGRAARPRRPRPPRRSRGRRRSAARRRARRRRRSGSARRGPAG